MYVFLTSVFVLAADMISKYLIQKFMDPYESIPILKNIFHLTYVQNTGGGFSILEGHTSLLVFVSSMVILAMIYILIKPYQRKSFGIVMAMILGGAVGNLADRLRYGYVVDFDFGYGLYLI